MIDSDNLANDMMWMSTYCIRKVLLVFAFTMAPVVTASAETAGLVSASPPLTMARFYIVDSDGRSASDKTVPVRAPPQHERSSEPRQMRPDRRQRKRTSKARENSDSRNPAYSRLNQTTAWQCEQHGFFFTADGRCVRPTIRMKRSTPPTSSRRPIRSNRGSR